MRAVIEIIGEMKASFLLTLTLDNFADRDGDWSCIPGFLPATKARFGASNNAGLFIYDKEPASTTNAAHTTQRYMVSLTHLIGGTVGRQA